MHLKNKSPIEILLVEDNSGDARLAKGAFREAQISNCLNIVNDGVEAPAFLRLQETHADTPDIDLIMLDLNLPRKNGHEVLNEIKSDEVLSYIPVVILTTSKSESDILQGYDLQANCYVTKPIDSDEFMDVMRSVEEFWLSTVKLPNRKG